MRMKPTSLTLIAAIFLAFFATSLSPHAAWAQNETCQTPGDQNVGSSGLGPSNVNIPPGAQGLNGGCLGGYGTSCNNGDFYNGMTNASTNVVSGRQAQKHAFMQNVQSIDAKLHYCFGLLKNTFLFLNTAGAGGGIFQAIVGLIIHVVIAELTTILCSLVQQLVADFKAMIAMAGNFLCLPIPKLKLPRFKLPGLGGGNCSGINLLNLAGLKLGVGATNSAVYWNIWNRNQQQ